MRMPSGVLAVVSRRSHADAIRIRRGDKRTSARAETTRCRSGRRVMALGTCRRQVSGNDVTGEQFTRRLLSKTWVVAAHVSPARPPTLYLPSGVAVGAVSAWGWSSEYNNARRIYIYIYIYSLLAGRDLVGSCNMYCGALRDTGWSGPCGWSRRQRRQSMNRGDDDTGWRPVTRMLRSPPGHPAGGEQTTRAVDPPARRSQSPVC